MYDLSMIRVLLLLLACLTPSFGEWQLIWNDEFDKKGAPDPKKWGYEEGFVRNQEDQYYTKDRRENARVENGCLIIEARKEKFKNPAFESKENPNWQKNREYAEYTSACLHTLNLAAWKYGKVEIRAQLPMGQGAWPAFWMMGEDRTKVGWPKCGEIDIMEHVSSSKGTVYGTSHWPKGIKEQGTDKKSFNVKNNRLQGWHTYGIEWDEKSITYFFDGKPYGVFDIGTADRTVEKGQGDGRNPFRKPYYLLINLAVGGAWGGPPDAGDYPQKLVVDYVRIYRKVEKGSFKFDKNNSYNKK